jgi:outer membrane protein assembly factor BamB
VVRYAVANTGISLDIVVQPSFTPAGTMYASASDSGGVIQQPVAVTPNQDGTWTFTVDSVAALAAGHYTGELVLKLCSDQACATPQPVPSVSVPYDVTVLTAASAWPGNKLTPLAPWPGVADWSTFQGNPAHTGYVPVALKPDQFSLRWKTDPISTSTVWLYGYAATLTAENGVFYAGGGKQMKARKEFDGTTTWLADVSALPNPSVNPPAVADGVVYIVAGQQDSTYMVALNPATVSIKFQEPMSSQWENYLAPVAFDGAVYTNAGTGLYAFTSSGAPMFKIMLAQAAMWSPAVDGTAVYAYTGASLTVFDRKTGAQLRKIWDTSFTNYTYDVGGSAVLGSPGVAFAAAYDNAFLNGGTMGNQLLKFNTNQESIEWRINGNYPVTPAYSGGVLYAPNTNPYRLEARSESDGALRWSWTPPQAGEKGWREPVVTNNLLFVSTDSSTYAVDLRTHKTVWSYPAGGRLALTRSGILYIQNTDALVAINVK